MEYRQACRRIEETGAKKNSVGDLAAFYRWLGRPGSASRILHVAGTNGKGSVCAFLTGILSAAGYRVGQFTSPHLVTLLAGRPPDRRGNLCAALRPAAGAACRIQQDLGTEERKLPGTDLF